MQTLEALFSLMIFLSLLCTLMAGIPPPHAPDDSLYRLQLAEDSWRVLYLRGDLEDFSVTGAALKQDIRAIGEQTGLCIYLEGVRNTGCRDEGPLAQVTASIHRTVIEDGAPKTVTLTIGIPDR